MLELHDVARPSSSARAGPGSRRRDRRARHTARDGRRSRPEARAGRGNDARDPRRHRPACRGTRAARLRMSSLRTLPPTGRPRPPSARRAVRARATLRGRAADRLLGRTRLYSPPRAGTRPAQRSDDLPLPEGPTSASRGVSTSLAVSSSTSRSRPKKTSTSSGSKGASPLYGQMDTRGCCTRVVVPLGGFSVGSCTRIARSSSWSSTPGSRPSSSFKSVRVRR